MPLKRLQGTEFIALQWLADLLAVTAGLFFAYWFRFHSNAVPLVGGWDTALYWNQLPWAIVFWMGALYLAGNYRNDPLVITFNRARRLVVASGLAIMLVIVRNYFFRVEDVARILFPISLTSVIIYLVGFRVVLQRMINAFLTGNRLPRSRVLLIGLNPVSYRIAARILRHPEYALEVAGFLTSRTEKVGLTIAKRPVFGTIENLREVIREQNIQDVFVTQNEFDHDELFSLFLKSEMETARIHIVPTLTEMMRTVIYYDELLGVPVYKVRDSPLSGARRGLKRAMDLALSFFGLLILSPVLALIATLIKLDGSGPVLFKQTRTGLDGRSFDMLKFRSMKADAESQGAVWGDRSDSRATVLGSFLRRWSLDELPQLWNVLKGEMSLVGPRPEQTVFAEQFKEMIPHYMSRHHVKAGMTGWAQVHGLRGQTSIPQRLRYDLYYIENWSLWLDVKILMMTFYRPRRARIRAAKANLDRYLADEALRSQHGAKQSDDSVPPVSSL